MKTRFA